MKRTILLSVIAVLVAVAARAQEMPDHLIKLMYTGNVISNFYVDAPDNDKITEAGVRAMLKELDPH